MPMTAQRAPGSEGLRLRHRPIRGQPGVRVGRDVLGGEILLELEGRALHRLQVLGEATVDVQARELRMLAMHVLAPAAGRADAVGLQRVHDDGVARPQRGDRWTYLLDPSRVLMPERAGQPWILMPRTLHHMQVRAADAGSADPDDHLVRTLDRRVGHLVEVQPIVSILV